MFNRGKRGQATAFIIAALAIVAIIAVVFFVSGPRGGLLRDDASDPRAFLEGCIEEEFRENVELIASQGGELNPEGFIVYKDKKIKYLCYTNEYYKTCVVQQPLLKEQFEKELGRMLSPIADNCANNLVDALERSEKSVSKGEVKLDVEFSPGKAGLNIEAPLTVSDEVSRTYKNFEISYASEMYDLLAISENIVDFEASLGDSEITAYTQYYPDLIIRKDKLGDGSTIYNVENVVSKEKFTFASRSLAWPAGLRGE
ncbi:MAG: hypothetical protein AABW80_03350 [Nanoarchaeota archaeon]